MMAEFDPYYTWLSIAPEEQPPSLYRLLGLRPFEHEPDVIENAADRQMAHLRTFQSGKHSEQSQRLLNEVASAKLNLLNEKKRAEYDEKLQEFMDLKAEGSEPDDELSTTLAGFLQQIGEEKAKGKKAEPTPPPKQDAKPKTPRPAGLVGERQNRTFIIAVAIGVGVLVLLAAGIWWALRSGGPRKQAPPAGKAAHNPDGTKTGNPAKQATKEKSPPAKPRPTSATTPAEDLDAPPFTAFRTLPGGGNQAFEGTLGLDFDVLSPIKISELGVFDAHQDGIAGKLVAELWSRSGDTGTKLASLEFTPEDAGTLEKGTGSRFKALTTPLVLQAGSYTVCGSGFLAGDLYTRRDKPDSIVGTTNEGGGLIRFSDISRWVETIGFPTKHDKEPNKWACATFKFEAAGESLTPPDRPKSDKSPVPSDEAQQGITRQIAEVYKLSQPRSAEEKLHLARELFALGKKSEEGPTERYVLMRLAMEQAEGARDAALVAEVVDAMRAEFDIDVATKPADLTPVPAHEPTVDKGLVSRCTFDEDAGDSLGQHSGAFVGDASIFEDPDRGSVLTLDGQGDFVSLDGMVDLTGGEYSVALWFKSGNAAHNTILAATKGAHGILLEVKGGKVRYLHRFPFGSTAGSDICTQKAYNDGQWHHLVAVKSPTTATLYVDGGNVGSKANSSKFNAPVRFVVGRLSISNEERYFSGQIDDLRIYDRALRAEEAANLAHPKPTPFDRLAETGNLAPIEGSRPGTHVLGELVLPPDAKVDLKFLGGRTAIRPPRYFLMEFDADKEYWPIYLHEGRGKGPSSRTPVARIAMKGQTLYFQWAQGTEPDQANCLLNCGLLITVDDKSRWLPLGQPQQVKPVTVNLVTGVARSVLPEDRLPPYRDSLRLQIIRLEGGFPEPVFHPGDTMAPGGRTIIKFKDESFPNFWLQAGFNTKVRPVVEVAALINYEWGNVAPCPFRGGEAAKVIGNMVREQQRLVMDLERTNPKDKRRKDELNKILKPIQEKLKKFAKLNDLYTKLEGQPGKVHFRVYTVTEGEYKVTLMQSFGPDTQKQATPAKKP